MVAAIVALNSASDCCTLGQRPRETRDDAGVLGKPRIGLFARIAARQRYDTQNTLMIDQFGIDIGLLGQRQLEHDMHVIG